MYIRPPSDIAMVTDFVVRPDFVNTVPTNKEIEDEVKFVKPVLTKEALVDLDPHKGLVIMTTSSSEQFDGFGTSFRS